LGICSIWSKQIFRTRTDLCTAGPPASSGGVGGVEPRQTRGLNDGELRVRSADSARRSQLQTKPVSSRYAAALRAGTSSEAGAWLAAFIDALAGEAADARQLLMELEQAWFTARITASGRRRDSHAAAAIELLAATPLISATTLAAALDAAVKIATPCSTACSPPGIARGSKR
jgi:hypothetical protein